MTFPSPFLDCLSRLSLGGHVYHHHTVVSLMLFVHLHLPSLRYEDYGGEGRTRHDGCKVWMSIPCLYRLPSHLSSKHTTSKHRK